MTDLVFREEDEGLARHRMVKLINFMLDNGERVGSAVRHYESKNGDTYRIVYSMERYGDWHAKFLFNDVTLCVFLFPETWFSSQFVDMVRDATDNPIKEERVFISEFYEFIDDYREEE